MGWLVFLSKPQDTHLAWLKTNDARKHTWRKESILLSQRLQSGMIIAHNIFLQSSQLVLISSLLPYLSLTRFLAFSPSLQTAQSSLPRFKTTRPFWSLNRSFCFLFLSRRKRLSSAHYKRSQHSGAMLETPARKKNKQKKTKTLKLIWQGKITGDLSQQTQNQQPHRRCIAKLPISTVSSGILEYNIRAELEKHIVIRKERL